MGLNLAKSHLRRAQLFQRRALAALPPRQRSAVVLRHYFGYSTRDTALLLRIPEGTAKSLLHRALRTLESGVAVREEFR